MEDGEAEGKVWQEAGGASDWLRQACVCVCVYVCVCVCVWLTLYTVRGVWWFCRAIDDEMIGSASSASSSLQSLSLPFSIFLIHILLV